MAENTFQFISCNLSAWVQGGEGREEGAWAPPQPASSYRQHPSGILSFLSASRGNRSDSWSFHWQRVPLEVSFLQLSYKALGPLAPKPFPSLWASIMWLFLTWGSGLSHPTHCLSVIPHSTSSCFNHRVGQCVIFWHQIS